MNLTPGSSSFVTSLASNLRDACEVLSKAQQLKKENDFNNNYPWFEIEHVRKPILTLLDA